MWLPHPGSDRDTRSQSPLHFQLCYGAIMLVVRPGFEPEPIGSGPIMLPLHHRTTIWLESPDLNRDTHPVKSVMGVLTALCLIIRPTLQYKNKKTVRFPRRSFPALFAALHSKTSQEAVRLLGILVLLVL